MKKILVTGGLGYIGSHTVIDLVENGFMPIIVDNCINAYEDTLDRIQELAEVKIKYYNIDLCTKEKVNELFNHEPIDGVIHFAAHKAVGESMEKPLLYFENNINSLLNIMDAAHKFQCEAFIFSSSCTVYGDVTQCPVTEDTPLQEAASVYGRTKQMGEQILRDSSPMMVFKSSLLRYFNPAGAHVSGRIGEDPKKEGLNLIPVITETAIGKREVVNVFGNDYDTRDGSCIRDYIHVMDLAHAHTLALQYIFEGKQNKNVEVFNLGIGEGVSVLEAIHAFEKVSGEKVNYKIAPRRAGDVMAIYSNYEKARRELGWSPKYNIDDIMETAWKWELNKNKLRS